MSQRMTGNRRHWSAGPLRLGVLLCAFSTTTGCGSLWPFSTGDSTDAVETKARADKAAEAEKDKSADPGKVTAKNKPADSPADTDDEPPSKWRFLMPWKWESFHPTAPKGEAETLVLHGENLEPEKAPSGKKTPPKIAKELSGAYEVYRLGDYEKAERIFHRVADDTGHAPPPVAEEARFYEAECLRRRGKYPRACDTYHKVLIDFPRGTYRDMALQRIFDIANYWLDDTRKEMEASKKKEGNKDKNDLPKRVNDSDAAPEERDAWKSWMVVGHWEKTKPLFDEEGRALEALDWVYLCSDCIGPLAEEALWLQGRVKLYRENYRDADEHFTRLSEHFPNGKYAATATELCILCKHMSTGGAAYDGRKVAEARQMIDRALKNYPTLAHEKKDFLIRQLFACNMQQAEKDFRTAEFYRRTGHPGSAYWYYDLVRRRYPGTPFSDKAVERMLALRHDVEQKQKDVPEPGQPAHADREAAPPPRALTPGMPLEEMAPTPRQVPAETAPPPKPLPPNMPQ